MDQLIVGLSETEEARDALRLGEALAEAEEAELHVVAVLPFETGMIDPDEFEKVRQRHFDSVFEVAEDALERHYTPHRLDDISPPAALAQLAEELGADAIVIGSAHYGPIGRVLTSDVGHRLIQGAPCSIIVAPRGFRRREQIGFAAIGVGYDGTAESARALATAEHLAREVGGSLRLIAVMPRFITPGRISGTDVGYSRAIEEDLRSVLDQARTSIEGIDVETTLSIGDPADELATEAAGLDLLVIGSRGYGPLRRVLLGGVSTRVMRSAPCPVVVVPRPD